MREEQDDAARIQKHLEEQERQRGQQTPDPIHPRTQGEPEEPASGDDE